jgi:hypothetical protein
MKKWLLVSLAALLPLLCLACGPAEYALAGTSRAAGTDGKVTVDKIEGSYIVKVELEHLPPPNRLGQGINHYVMWLQPQNQQPQREARLEYDEDDRTAVATATTPQGRFTLIITGERTAAPTTPSDVVVIRKVINPES